MHSLSLFEKEVSQTGIIICRVTKGAALTLLGYNIHAEDESKNPVVVGLYEVGHGVVAIVPVAPSVKATTFVWLGEGMRLHTDGFLGLKIFAPPQMAPCRVWGTVWVQSG